ncbi:MAG: hypothetical protein KY476_11405, partial [Planctomycetes bacterium]|nr:hypothetical protein [Planctomycetota bacterium]
MTLQWSITALAILLALSVSGCRNSRLDGSWTQCQIIAHPLDDLSGQTRHAVGLLQVMAETVSKQRADESLELEHINRDAGFHPHGRIAEWQSYRLGESGLELVVAEYHESGVSHDKQQNRLF